MDCFHCQIACGGSPKARSITGIRKISLFRALNIGSFSKTVEIVNRLHLIKEPPQGGSSKTISGCQTERELRRMKIF